MEMKKETRFNTDTRKHETKHELWTTELDLYVLEVEIKTRIFQIKAIRDKCGISPDDMESEPNQHIRSLLKFCEQLGIEMNE